MQHLTSYTIFESFSAEPLYPLYLTNGDLSFMGAFPQEEAKQYWKFLNEHVDHQTDDLFSLGEQPLDPHGYGKVYVNGNEMQLMQGDPDLDDYAIIEQETIYPLDDLLQYVGSFISVQSDADEDDWIVPPHEAITRVYPYLKIPAAGWERI